MGTTHRVGRREKNAIVQKKKLRLVFALARPVFGALMPQEQAPPELGGALANDKIGERKGSTYIAGSGVSNSKRVRKPYRESCITCD